MQVSSWLTCLWPGLPRLWWRGDWRALLTAIAFAVVLDGWIVSRFLWPELLPAKVVTVGGLAVLAFWIVSVWQGRRAVGELGEPVGDQAPQGLFIQAQGEYLQRHWLEAEHLLQDLIRQYPRDAEAQLMLATLCRRTGRRDEARERLDALDRQERAERWAAEVAAERRLLQRLAVQDSAGDGISPQEQAGTAKQ